MTLSHVMKLVLELIRVRNLARSARSALSGAASGSRRRHRIATRCGLASPFLLAACSGAPAQNVLGSFFPSWMACALLGIAAAVLCRLLLVAAGVEPYVPAPPLTFIAFAAASALLAWLLWFGH